MENYTVRLLLNSQILKWNIIFICRKHIIHRLPFGRLLSLRLLPLLRLIIRHRHVADDRALLASITLLPAQLLHDVVRVTVLPCCLARPRNAVEIGSFAAFVERGFVDLANVDFDFDWSWHISFGFGLLKLVFLCDSQLNPRILVLRHNHRALRPQLFIVLDDARIL